MQYTVNTQHFLVRGLAVWQSEEFHINDDSTSPASWLAGRESNLN